MMNIDTSINLRAEKEENVENYEEPEILKADVIYVVIKKSCYVPRSLRVQWFLQHLHTKIRISPLRDLDRDDSEFVIIAVSPHSPPDYWTSEDNHKYEYSIELSTNVIFLGQVYRQVYCLDISPSVSTVDIQHGQVLLDVIIEALQTSIRLLIKPFQIPGSSQEFKPDIFITVIAHTPFYISPAQQVLVQGWRISEDNVNEFLEAVLRQLKFIEDEVARVSGSVHEQFERDRRKSIMKNGIQRSMEKIFKENYEQTTVAPNIAMVSPGSSFLNLLRYGMLALKLLPASNFSNLVVITDGMIIMPDTDTLDSVLNHMRYNDIACYFLHVGSQFHPHCGFGFVPYTEIMQLISVATNGAYMQFQTQHKLAVHLNVYQQNFLTWNLKRKSVISDLSTPHFKDGEWYISNRHFYGDRGPQLIVKKYLENDINVTLYGVLACRMREGFILKDMYIRDNQLIISFTLPWTNHIYIDYVLSCQWPLVSAPFISTHYLINIQAPYEFLHDISCRQKVPIKSPFRQALIARFWRSLKSFAQSDLLLSHLESFMNSNSSYYLPESLKNGMPLYNLLLGSNQPTISSSDIGYSQFGNIWRPACLLNNNLWQKWFHADRVGVIFKHDDPLNLFTQKFESRIIKYSSTGLQCRQATNTLFNFLKTYCSFVLIENHSYIKFLLPNESGTGKHSFLVIRSIVKPPYAVLHVAFLYNIPGRVRANLLEDFKRSVTSLKIPRLPVVKDNHDYIFGPEPFDSHANCCVLLDKPLEKILIRYEQMPKEFRTVVFPDGTQPSAKTFNALSSNRGLITTLSRYLHHRRWIWKTNVGQSVFLPPDAVEKVLSTLIKKRLQEGFYFAHYCAGICNMVLEVQMKGARIEKEDIDGIYYEYQNGADDNEQLQSCIIQYVVFSPKTFLLDDDNEDNDSHAKVVELVTECWIEPQQGVITDCPPVRNYMSNLQYHQLPDAIWATDAKCISALFTFEYLRLMCEDLNTKVPDSVQYLLTEPSSTGYWPNVAPFEDERIRQIPFAYSLPNLLCQCTQEMLQFNLFSVDVQDKSEVSLASNRLLLESVYSHLSAVHTKELLICGQEVQYLIRNVRRSFRDLDETYFFASEVSLQSDLVTGHDWERMMSWALDGKRKSSSTPRSSQTFTKVETNRSKPSDSGSQQSSTFDVSFISNLEDVEWLKWKCFIRFTSKNQCLVTIIPNDLDVIKRIVLGHAVASENLSQGGESSVADLNEMSESAIATRNDSFSFYTAYSSSSKELVDESDEFQDKTLKETFRLRASTWDPVRGVMETSACIDDRLRTNSVGARVRPLSRLRAKHSFDLDSREKLSENASHVAKYVPLTLPLYVCNCTLDNVIAYLIGKSEEKARALHYDTESENNLEEQCRNITIAFRKYFILSLFKCLLQGYDIPVTDVDQAFSKCETSVVTIDITEYLKVVCRHLKNLISADGQEEKDKNYSKPSSYFTSSNVCNELRCIHCLIKRKFINILTLDFKPIPSKPEFYYFSPSWSKESKPSSVGMLSPGLMENPSTGVSVEQIIPPVSVTNVSDLNAWETCKESVNSDDNAACTSLLSNMDSDSLNETSNESLAEDSNPFFIRIDCKISSENKTGKCSLNEIPTCICDILNLLDKPLDVNASDLRVTLDLSCLTSPYVGTKKKCSKNILSNISPKTADYSEYICDNVLDNTWSFEDSRIPKQLEDLPDFQYNALNTFLTQIKWLMKDEIVTFMLDTNPVTSETLRTVCEHVESSPNAGTCFIEKVPLSFVFNQEKTSINNFLQDFGYMKLLNYRLKKLDNMYYLIKNTNEKHRSVSRREYFDDYPDMSEMSKMLTSSMEKVNEDQEQFSQVFSSSESVNENYLGRGVCIEYVNTRLGSTTDPDDEISRGIQSTVQWILEREMSEVELPNFWLIMTITEDYVTVYFHCRFLEFKNKKIDDYVMIRENVIQKIKDMCKVINQKMLLDNLHDSRICDQLLVPDPQQSDEDDVPINTVLNTFGPGCFACPVVWETKFILHPRLKISHLKGAVSRGIQALCSILSGFSVNNRKNLFVYQDNCKNVFYLRLYESIQGCSKHDSEETTSSGSFSRSSSFTSLSRKQFDEQLPFLLDETRSRNKSFSDASETNLLRNDDFITLKVYGISEAGKDVKSELVQLLQNKLDDAVLDVISVMLSRNPLCKLLSEDVHFIQKPNQLPNNVVQFAVHDQVVDHMYTLRQLIRQNVQTFAYLPKYSDSRPSFHFQDYSVAEDSSKRISEHDIFLYNQPPSCGKAIACFALALVDCDGEVIECEEKSRTPVHVENEFWLLDDIKSMTMTEHVNEGNAYNSCIRIEFRIWKQGKLNMDVLNAKFLLAIRHALWELVMEKYLLPYPIFFPNTDQLCEVYHALMPSWMDFGAELNVSSVREWDTPLPVRSNVSLIFKELNSMFLPHETACYGFYRSHDATYKPCITFDDKVQHKGENCVLVGLNLTYLSNSYEISKVLGLDMRSDARLQRSPSSSQEDGQSIITKRKFILVFIADAKIKLYMYNWTKEKIEIVTKEITSFSEWLRARSSLIFSIVEQKMGIFFNLPIQRPDSLQKTIDVCNTSLDALLRFPVSSKAVSGIQLNSVSDAFKDVKLPENIRNRSVNQNPFLHHVSQLREILKVDRKAHYKHLHNVWQRKASSSSTSVNEEWLNNFLLQGRLIHFVLTPLLFMPRWRLKTAATRDHSLSLKTQNQNDDSVQEDTDENWHTNICSNFIHEYKQYLNSLGFHSIQRFSEDFPSVGTLKHPLDNVTLNVHYMQKFLLGGVLLYELYFSEPFFNTKLYALEYARLNVKTSSLVSQFTISFLDECDRIKFQMHLHSFTYDYHVRCLHQFITDQQPLLSYGYHIVNFLDDFIKYYPKAPNFARNLVQTEYVTVSDVTISPSQLFDYLLTHRKNYNMAAFTMAPEFVSSDSVEDHEYILVKNKSSSPVCYKDVNDQHQTDDFDIVIIISHTNDVQESNIMKFQIYVIITSRREMYPKVELDQKIGKFRTVSTSYDYSSSNEDEGDSRLSVCEDSGSSKGSSTELKEPRRKRLPHHVEIKLEPINYLGYYSSHEEAMQKLMFDEVEEAKKYIQWMVTQGTFDCKTHILWQQLLCSSPTPLNYEEFQNLLSMADVFEITNIDDQLRTILNQPISWLLSFIKALDAKQPDQCHLFSSPSGNTQEFLILHPQYTNGFMMIVLNLQTNACTMSLVYRRGSSDGEEAKSILQTLFEQIINNLCFHLWIDAF